MSSLSRCFFQKLLQGWNWRAFLLFYLVLNGYVNVYKTKVFGPNGKGSDLPAVIKPGYHYCHFCQLNAPPRSHHCPGFLFLFMITKV